MTRRWRRWRNVVNPRSGTPCRRRRWISIEWIRRRRRWRIRIINRRRWWRRNRVDHGCNSAPHHSDDSRGERDAVVAVIMRRWWRRCKYAPAYGDGTDCCQKKFHCFHDGTSLCVWFILKWTKHVRTMMILKKSSKSSLTIFWEMTITFRNLGKRLSAVLKSTRLWDGCA